MSSPGNYQCSGIEIESIESDLVVGNGYNYHFLWGGERAKSKTIKELNFNSINRKQFFDWMFDPSSALVLNLYLHYLDERFKNLREN